MRDAILDARLPVKQLINLVWPYSLYHALSHTIAQWEVKTAGNIREIII